MAGKFDRVKKDAANHAPHGTHKVKSKAHKVEPKSHLQNETTLTSSALSSTPDAKQSPPFVLPAGMKLADPKVKTAPAGHERSIKSGPQMT